MLELFIKYLLVGPLLTFWRKNLFANKFKKKTHGIGLLYIVEMFISGQT